jgi:hypothetical protein
LERKNCGKYTDADFIQAQKENVLNALLDELDTDLHHVQSNLIFHGWVPWMYLRLSAAAVASGYGISTNTAAMNFVVLLTTDSEPVYNTAIDNLGSQYWASRVGNHFGGSNLNSHKRIVTDAIEPYQYYSDPNGREALTMRNRLMWLPNHVVSSDIRGIGFASANNKISDDWGTITCRMGRIRLKDVNGLPVVYSKTASQILLLEYRFTIASV